MGLDLPVCLREQLYLGRSFTLPYLARYFCGGDSFGEVSVLASTPRTAWIMARTYCILTKVGVLAQSRRTGSGGAGLGGVLKHRWDGSGPPRHGWVRVRCQCCKSFGGDEFC